MHISHLALLNIPHIRALFLIFRVTWYGLYKMRRIPIPTHNIHESVSLIGLHAAQTLLGISWRGRAIVGIVGLPFHEGDSIGYVPGPQGCVMVKQPHIGERSGDINIDRIHNGSTTSRCRGLDPGDVAHDAHDAHGIVCVAWLAPAMSSWSHAEVACLVHL